MSYRSRFESLRQLREQKGWTQETLAELAGVSHRTLQQMESEKEFENGRTFTDETSHLVAKALDCLVSDIAHTPTHKLSASLFALLDSIKTGCKERGCRVHTPHIIQALLEPGRALSRALEQPSILKLAHCDGETIARKIDETVSFIEPNAEAFADFDWEAHKYVKRALQYAWMKPKREDANDADLALAVLRIGLFEGKGSQIVQRVRKWLGDAALVEVTAFLRDYVPLSPDADTPPIPPGGSSLG